MVDGEPTSGWSVDNQTRAESRFLWGFVNMGISEEENTASLEAVSRTSSLIGRSLDHIFNHSWEKWVLDNRCITREEYSLEPAYDTVFKRSADFGADFFGPAVSVEQISTFSGITFIRLMVHDGTGLTVDIPVEVNEEDITDLPEGLLPSTSLQIDTEWMSEEKIRNLEDTLGITVDRNDTYWSGEKRLDRENYNPVVGQQYLMNAQSLIELLLEKSGYPEPQSETQAVTEVRKSVDIFRGYLDRPPIGPGVTLAELSRETFRVGAHIARIVDQIVPEWIELNSSIAGLSYAKVMEIDGMNIENPSITITLHKRHPHLSITGMGYHLEVPVAANEEDITANKGILWGRVPSVAVKESVEERLPDKIEEYSRKTGDPGLVRTTEVDGGTMIMANMPLVNAQGEYNQEAADAYAKDLRLAVEDLLFLLDCEGTVIRRNRFT